MAASGFPVVLVRGVTVVTAPEEIDATNAYFALTGIGRVIPCFASLDEALDHAVVGTDGSQPPASGAPSNSAR
jgi:hypothetical protein